MPESFLRGDLPTARQDARADRLAYVGLILLVLGLFSKNLITRSYPVEPFWMEISWVQMPLRAFFSRCISLGRFPLWNPHVSLGYPILAHSHSFYVYPPAWIFYWSAFLPAMTIYIIFHLLLVALTSYRLIRYLGARPAGSFVGAASMAVGGYVFSNTGFMPVISTFAWAPLAIHIVVRQLREATAKRLAALAAITAIQFFGGDMETLYNQWVCIIFAVVLAHLLLKDILIIRLRALLAVGAAVFLAIVLAAVQFLPLAELMSRSERLAGWQLFSLKGRYVFILGEYIQWLIKFLLPSPFQAHYVNAGFVAIVFGALAWRAGGRRVRWFLGLMFLFCFVNSLPYLSPLQRLTSHLPVLKSFRFPWRLLFFVQLTTCAAAAFGVDGFLEKFTNGERLMKWIPSGLAIYGAVSLLNTLLSRKPWPNLIPLLALAVLLMIVAFSGVRLKAKGAFVLLFAIVMADLFTPSLLNLPRSPSDIMDPYPAVYRLFRENEHSPNPFSRSFMLAPERDSHLLSGMEPAWGGFSPAFIYSVYPERTTRFLNLMLPLPLESDKQYTLDKKRRPFYLYSFRRNFLEEASIPWYNLMGLRYIISGGVDLKFVDRPRQDTGAYFKMLYHGEVDIYTNENAYPRAFLAAGAKAFANPSSVFQFMGEHPTFDYRNTVLLESRAQVQPTPQTTMEMPVPAIERYYHDRVEISANSPSPAYLVLTDSYYPGWRAELDGTEEKIFPADGAFRAVALPKGARRIVFIYKPAPFRIGLWATLAIGLCALGFGLRKAKREG